MLCPVWSLTEHNPKSRLAQEHGPTRGASCWCTLRCGFALCVLSHQVPSPPRRRCPHRKLPAPVVVRCRSRPPHCSGVNASREAGGTGVVRPSPRPHGGECVVCVVHWAPGPPAPATPQQCGTRQAPAAVWACWRVRRREGAVNCPQHRCRVFYRVRGCPGSRSRPVCWRLAQRGQPPAVAGVFCAHVSAGVAATAVTAAG